MALFFFFLGKKTSNINKEGDFGKENNAIEEYQQPTSAYPAAADEETSEDKDGNTQPSAEDGNDVAEQPQNIAIEPEANQENNNGQDVLPDAADKNKESDGSWTKRTYSKDELEYIAEYFKNRLTDAPARAEKVKEYILGKELSELENIMASGMGDPNYVYDQGLTPLNMAVMSNNMDICRLLVAYGADVNKATPNLPAPLILAIGLRNEELIKFFIDSGADVSQKYEIEGKTVIPLNAAEGMGLKQTAELIKQKLAQKK